MPYRSFIVAIDLGTSAITASHINVEDSFNGQGKLIRQKGLRNVTDVKDWPGGNSGSATGHVCLPTDLVYDKATGQLVYWGFQAQRYLDDPLPDIPRENVLVIEHIKLLLPDPDEAGLPSAATERYRAMRQHLASTLGKSPYDVFEDSMDRVIDHIIGSANRRYVNGLHSCHIELILAFPSGWKDSIHTKVAEIGAKSMMKAITAIGASVVFGIENVYTVSETLCGVKEWLRDAIAESAISNELDEQKTNLDELQEGDCFLPIDIGGGTGCMTPLRLVTKNPLRVDQLAPTTTLQVSGEAVEAEFENWLRPRVTKIDYPGDIPLLIHQICRRFKEEKKDCGSQSHFGFSTWSIQVPTLRVNRSKGFEKDCMRIDRSLLNKAFDPVLENLESAIHRVYAKFPTIKTIVFLGQFGSSSEYLRAQMANSSIGRSARLQYSQSGKLNVVKGAMSERLYLDETFIRKSETRRSIGSLVTLPYFPGSIAEKIFPNPKGAGAVPFEQAIDGNWLKVIEWAIPKGTILEDGQTYDVGQDGRKHHYWLFREKDIDFQDIIVVSDETTPPVRHPDGKSYTLWTEAHARNELTVNNQRIQVQQLPFTWNLAMSQRLDHTGNLIGTYEREDLVEFWYPEEFKKGHRRERLRKLEYDPVWEITEMQVKLHIRPIFPHPIGPLTTQLAKERPLGSDDKTYSGESRSKALERDIEISSTVLPDRDLDIRHYGDDNAQELEWQRIVKRKRKRMEESGSSGRERPTTVPNAVDIPTTKLTPHRPAPSTSKSRHNPLNGQSKNLRGTSL